MNPDQEDKHMAVFKEEPYNRITWVPTSHGLNPLSLVYSPRLLVLQLLEFDSAVPYFLLFLFTLL